MKLPYFWKSLLSERGKISTKRFLSLVFSAVACYEILFDHHETAISRIDALFFFIGSLLAMAVAGNHKSLQREHEDLENPKGGSVKGGDSVVDPARRPNP